MKDSGLGRILIVEDDLELASLIAEYLEAKNYTVGVEHDGAQALGRILQEQPDLVVLDLMLPGLDGISICREVRYGFRGAILMLTASGDSVDQILGLEIGADDYVQKPVEPRVLLARIRALLRRNVPPQGNTVDNLTVTSPQSAVPELSSDVLQFGDLRIDSASRVVTVSGAVVDLTTPEFDVLVYLAENAGKIISRDELFKQLRNLEYDGQSRFIDITISYIRKKLGDHAGQLLKTVRGKGYLFVR